MTALEVLFEWYLTEEKHCIESFSFDIVEDVLKRSIMENTGFDTVLQC